MTEVQAISKNIRITPKKVNLLLRDLRGKKASQALESLRFMPKKAALPIAKTMKSAIANAKNNFKIDEDKLFIKEIVVNEGPTLKRYRPVSRGSAHQILKRTSHIKVVLEDR